MKTVRDACQLQPNALSITLGDQIEQLDELITAEENGAAFFEKTHITQGMQDLISEGISRLAGASSQAIFHLKQAMGGGKTHLLVGFGLLARHPELRKTYCAGMPHASDFNSANITAFNGRNSPHHFFWGEIASQLGKADLFQEYWASGPKAPDEKAWIQLFDGADPVLILLDEMPPYFEDLATRPVGAGTVADIATRAFANLLTAAGKKSNVCVVISDLWAAYQSGGALINRALDNARQELGRQERNITPVDLAANEIYDILRKRLFKSLPDKAEMGDIAAAFGRKLEEASKSKTASRGAEAIADEIAATYPFHPQLKHVIALFKENEQFKQTRGLIELVSRLLKSVWGRPANDVFLIGPQHFDLSVPEVRDKLTEISGMREVIAKDLWDAQQSAHAQVIDLQTGKEAAAQVGALLLTASLSTAVNAVKGLTHEEMVECLVSPLREPSDFLAAFEALEKVAWYVHHTPEGRYYFDRIENLTKLLQSLAHDAPQNQVDDLIRHRLREMFKPARKSGYEEVLPLPKLEDVTDRVRKGRVLLVVSPDSRIPPEEVQKFFEGLSQKNNLCVLTGDKTAMGSVEKAARHLFAAQKADGRIPQGHPQRDDLEKKQQTYALDFTATILNLFDKVFFPRQRAGRPPQLASKPLDMARDTNKDFNGEEQIEKTLTSNPLKLYLDVEKEFDAIRDKAQDLLWPENQDEARWSDVADRYAEQAGMVWLPPKGLDTLKAIACNRGLWEDLGNGYVTKKPKKKRTSVQVIAEPELGDEGKVRLRVNPQNAGPAPRIYYAEDAPVTDSNAQLKDQDYTTAALRVNFLITDPSGQYRVAVEVGGQKFLATFRDFPPSPGKRWQVVVVAPEDDFIGAVKKINRDVFLISLVILVGAALLVFLFSRSISKPILLLSAETDRIRNFQLEGQFHLQTHISEIQQLQGAIDRMKVSLRSFMRFAPEQIVKQVALAGKELLLEGERREVTLLFSDLRNFTRFAERTSPEEVVNILNVHFDSMVRIISDHGGYVVDFLGDSLFAVFGAPQSDPDHVFQAIKCAVAMQLTRARLNAELSAPHLPRLEMGIGINTGSCVVGNMGSQVRIKYGVVGHAVNLAARIETFTVGGQVLISAVTQHLVQDLVLVSGPFEAYGKGVEGAIHIWEVRGLPRQPDLSLPPTVPGLTPLSQPAPVHFRLITGKQIALDPHEAKFTKLSEAGAVLFTELRLDDFAAIQLQLPGLASEPIHIDGKVVGAGEARHHYIIRFSGLDEAGAAAISHILAESSKGFREPGKNQ